MSKLFETFDNYTKEEWLSKLKSDLKKEDVESLLHPIIDEIVTNAYVRNDDQVTVNHLTKNTNHLDPGYFYLNHWETCFELAANDPLIANKEALFHLKHGADAVRFYGDHLSNQEELRLLLREIMPEAISLHFDCGEATPALMLMLCDELQNHTQKSNLKGTFTFDFLSEFPFKGYIDFGRKESFAMLHTLISSAKDMLPEYKCLAINIEKFHEAGASTVQELALALAIGAEYGVYFSGKSDLKSFEEQSFIRMTVDSSYFLNIAKIRAMRLLWRRMMLGFGLEEIKEVTIHTSTSLRNKTSLDIYNNLLRTTVESMSAVVGGTDLHQTKLHDTGFQDYNRTSMRYALNIQHILRNESHLDKVADIAEGSHYIEDLTNKLVEASWAIFLDIEKQGGYLKSIDSGYIQKMIKTSAEKFTEQVKKGKKTIIGLNKYARVEQKSVSASLIDKEFIAREPEVELIEKLKLVSDFEKLRMIIQSKKKRAALLCFGDKKMSKARAEFSTDVLSSVGIESFSLTFHEGLEPLNQNMEALDADLWVFCTADSDYNALKELLPKIKNYPSAYIAGKTDDENLKQLLKGNLFLGMDLMDFMKSL
jgi:methylmalonyl-CoA mutase